MAYMNKELKAKIVAEVKKIQKKDWKITFAVINYSTIVVTIRKAPINLMEEFDNATSEERYKVNHYSVEDRCKNEEMKKTMKALIDAVDKFNYNNSDSMTDYFDVGYYVDIQFGSWNKPFESTK